MSHIYESSNIFVETSSFTRSPNQKTASFIEKLRNLLTKDLDLLMEGEKVIDEFIKIVDDLKQLKSHLDVKQIGLLVSIQMLANSFKTNVPYVLDSFKKFDYTRENNFNTVLMEQLTYLRQGEQSLHDEIAILIEKEASISNDIASMDASLEEEVAKKKEKRNKIIEVMKEKKYTLYKIAAEESEIDIIRNYQDRELNNAGKDLNVALKMDRDMKEAWNNIRDLLDLM
ncbi:hypothetical protein TSUD_71210 [Trifolium subterraneum]|uniref:Uncharacterized protein n=1 Tax=Trifolium subterraneum TaxID=3900 RepID=A0A2Z6N8I4_TRISU|nr:hypothetical protein TSUD_71210 [Trifolium subterraneum]